MSGRRGNERGTKRAIDISLSLVLLVLSAPVAVVGVALVLFSGEGPVIFRQQRVGRDGRLFGMYKLRTMTVETGDGSHPRVTAVGRWLRRFSIDELPQLINVLRGEMSLVGPRPEIPELVEHYSGSVTAYRDRHRVDVGLTGWAQVNGLRGAGSSIPDRIQYDNDYIESWSLRRDLWIMLRTVTVISRGS